MIREDLLPPRRRGIIARVAKVFRAVRQRSSIFVSSGRSPVLRTFIFIPSTVVGFAVPFATTRWLCITPYIPADLSVQIFRMHDPLRFDGTKPKTRAI